MVKEWTQCHSKLKWNSYSAWTMVGALLYEPIPLILCKIWKLCQDGVVGKNEKYI